MASSSCGNFCKHEFRRYHLSLDYVSPYDFVTFQCGCHKLYLFWRIFWALYHVVWIILTGVYSYQWAGHDPAQQIKWFIFLTDWAYFVLTLSTIIDAVCVVFISIKRDDILQDISPTMPWYLKVDWVFFNISNSISVLMSLMYWSLIYTSNHVTFLAIGSLLTRFILSLCYVMTEISIGSSEMTAVNIETHALNTVYVIINLLMTGIPVRFYHFFHSMIFAFIYVVFSVIYEVSGGTNHLNKSYIYKVIDWTNTSYTAMISLIVVLVAIPITHFVMFLFCLMRTYLNKKCCSRNKKSVTIITPDRSSGRQENDLELNHNDDVKVDLDSNKENKEINGISRDLNTENEKEAEVKLDILNEETIDIHSDEKVDGEIITVQTNGEIITVQTNGDLDNTEKDMEKVDEENNIKPN